MSEVAGVTPASPIAERPAAARPGDECRSGALGDGGVLRASPRRGGRPSGRGRSPARRHPHRRDQHRRRLVDVVVRVHQLRIREADHPVLRARGADLLRAVMAGEAAYGLRSATQLNRDQRSLTIARCSATLRPAAMRRRSRRSGRPRPASPAPGLDLDWAGHDHLAAESFESAPYPARGLWVGGAARRCRGGSPPWSATPWRRRRGRGRPPRPGCRRPSGGRAAAGRLAAER